MLQWIFNISIIQLFVVVVFTPTVSPAEDWYDKLLSCAQTQQDTFFFKSKDAKILALDESSVLRTYLSCYKIKHDTTWLRKAVQHISTIIDNMQDVPSNKLLKVWKGYNDGYKGWGTSSQNRYQEHLLYDACIVIPILRFYITLHETSEHQNRYLDRFSSFVQIVEKNIILKWYENWQEVRSTDMADGTLENWGDWQSLPHHKYSAMGTVFCLLSRISEFSDSPFNYTELKEWYSAEATEMAAFLRSHLKLNTQLAAYYWYYDPEQRRIENINQGDITLEFIFAAKNMGVVFNDIDIFRLLNTLRYKIWNRDINNPKFYYCINGGISEDNGYQMRTWVFLSLLDLDLQHAFDINLRNYINQNPVLQSHIRGGKTSCTIANLAYVLSSSTFAQQKLSSK